MLRLRRCNVTHRREPTHQKLKDIDQHSCIAAASEDGDEAFGIAAAQIGLREHLKPIKISAPKMKQVKRKLEEADAQQWVQCAHRRVVAQVRAVPTQVHPAELQTLCATLCAAPSQSLMDIVEAPNAGWYYSA